MLIDEFLCKREVLGKRAPHSFTPPLSVVGVSNMSNRPVNNFRSHMDSHLVEHDEMYFAFVVLREILYLSLLFHEVMADPKLKQHPEVIFLFESISSQSELVYPYSLKSQYPV
jgi:hypothetical protein